VELVIGIGVGVGMGIVKSVRSAWWSREFLILRHSTGHIECVRGNYVYIYTYRCGCVCMFTCVYAYVHVCVCVTLDSTVTGYTRGFTPAASLPCTIIRYRK
jgi:hypothetical protein